MTVWYLEEMRQKGYGKQELLTLYRFLTPEQIDAAFDYAVQNPDEIGESLRLNS